MGYLMMTDGPLSDQALDALRCTAAVLAAAPALRVRIRLGDEVLFEVRRLVVEEVSGHAILPACAFHTAVARAHRARKSGDRVAMAGVPAGGEPRIDWAVGADDLTLPGAMLRVAQGGDWWHVAPVAVPLPVALAALQDSPGDEHPGVTVAVRPDNDLGVTLLHSTTRAGDEAASARAVDALISAVGRVGVADLAARLGADADTADETAGAAHSWTIR